jgi:hypothetical protein
MRIKKICPPRQFCPNQNKKSIIHFDTLHIKVKPNNEFNIDNKIFIQTHSWGFLINNDLKKNNKKKFYFMGTPYPDHLVFYENENLFSNYCKSEKQKKLSFKNFLRRIK